MGSGAAEERAQRPPLVSVSVAAAERLHVVAHRAAASARNVEDWWGSPLETALAAVAMTRHSRAYRDDAERTLERLLRWWRDEQPRRISADVAALALTARAAADLQRAEPDLLAAVVDAVEDLATRESVAVPELHLALCVWALDDLVVDREQRPWPTLRRRVSAPRRGGVDEPLARYVAALVAAPFDGNRLVQELLSSIGSAPGVSESSLLLWLLTAAAERLARILPADDNALQVLVRRRVELVERLAGDVDEQTFVEPTLADINDDADDLRVVTFLSRSEALLLDVALAPADTATPWLMYREAESLFAAEAREARAAGVATRRRLLDRLAAVLGALALVSGFALWLGLRTLDVKQAVAYSAAIGLAAGVLAVAAAVLRRARSTALADSLGIFLTLLAVVALVNAANQQMKKPLIDDAAGLIVGAVVAGVATVLWQVLTHIPRDGERRL